MRELEAKFVGSPSISHKILLSKCLNDQKRTFFLNILIHICLLLAKIKLQFYAQFINFQYNSSLGEFSIELYWKHAPNTCRNFAELARRGYYNDVVFHRIIPGFMIQGGDPTGTGRGGSSIYGPTFADEIHSDLRHAGAGILSMANAGPNTNGR